jgi:hypothetical protein
LKVEVIVILVVEVVKTIQIVVLVVVGEEVLDDEVENNL